MKVTTSVIYPEVFGERYTPERRFTIDLNIKCEAWRADVKMQKGLCEMLFAGCGNHPGNEWEMEWNPGFTPKFDSGDNGINNVHYQWEKQETRSMSVGDLVLIDPRGIAQWFVCDSAGWLPLSTKEATSWMMHRRKYGGCSFELNEWKNRKES